MTDVEAIRALCRTSLGPSPDRVASPAGLEAAAETIRQAAADGLAVVPVGGGTRLAQGNRLRASGYVALSTRSMPGVLEYSPDDMVVTAGAGCSVAALQAVLAEHRQFVALDPPWADQATVGGVVATNSHGLWRSTFGSPRDRLLGLRALRADGAVLRAGGKVMKNVAGYDLCKLFAGSWGTLGLIVEATFKTNPLPETRCHIGFSAPTGSTAAAASLSLRHLRLDPAGLMVLGAPWIVWAGFQGSRAAVEWQRERVCAELRAAGLAELPSPPSEEEVRHAVVAHPGPLLARVSARPSELASLLSVLERAGSRAIRADTACGIVEAAFEGDDMSLQAAAERVRVSVPASATLVWPRCPAAWQARIDVWGAPQPAWRLTRSLKEVLDPTGVFSPGRFVGGV